MKRWLTAALALTMLLSPVLSAAGLAEEVFAAWVDEGVPEAQASDLPGMASEADAAELEAPIALAPEAAEGNEAEIADASGDGEAEIAAEPDATAGFAVVGLPDVLVVGQQCALSVAVGNGADVDAAQPTFETSDAGVATVDAAGVITAVGPGSATIRVTSGDQAVEKEVFVANEPDSMVLDDLSVGLKESGVTARLVMQPEDSAASVTWSVDDTDIVSVDPKTGALTGLKKGTATLTAIAHNGATASCRVAVVKAPSKVSVTLSREAMSVGDTVQIIPTVGSGTACSTFTYESSNTGVARVDVDGVITAVGKGTAVITTETYNGKKAKATLQVHDVPARVIFADPMTLCVGQTALLSPTAVAADGSKTFSTMTYALDEARSDGCVTLDAATGAVTALSIGSAVAVATAHNGVSGECALNVVEAPLAIELSAASLSLGLKERFSGLSVRYTMPDGSVVNGAAGAWSSSKPKVVSVDAATGEMTALKSGSAVITATVLGGRKLTCKVTVGKAPTKFTVDPETLILSAGGMTAQLGVTITSPKKGACSTFTYSSSNPAVVSVDPSGVVTSGAEGRATITVTSYNGKSASCGVRVLGEPARVILPARMSIGEGQVARISASAVSASGGEAMANYTFTVDPDSPDPGCVRANADGTITGLRLGQALVRAIAHNGVESDSACLIEVLTAPVALSLPESASMAAKETAGALEATVRFSNGDTSPATGLTWSSSKPKVVTVDEKTGALKALKKGTATITAKTYNNLTARCVVTVAKAPSKITLKPSSLKLSAGGMKFQLQATLPSGSGGTVTYTSSDPSVATVSDSGMITTGSKGTATIKASTSNGKSASCALTVTDVPAKASFAVTTASVSVRESVTPQVSVQTSSGSETQADLTFSVVSGAEYIDLDPLTGKVTGLRVGKAVVSFETHNGVRSGNTFTVIVGNGGGIAQPVTEAEVTLGVGELYAISGGSSMSWWSSSDSSVVTVDTAGRMTAVSTGEATVTGSGDSTSVVYEVTVKKAPTSVKLSPEKATLEAGETNQFTVKLSSGAGGGYSFTSSQPAVAQVSDDGTVTALSAGKTTVTVTTYNNLTATATLTVTESSSSHGTGDLTDEDVPEEMLEYDVASYQSYYTEDMSNAQKLEYVIYVGQTQLGKPYIYGGGYNDPDPEGFDCSGFVYWCFKHIGIKLGDSAYSQGYDSRFAKISSISDLKRGDVVCFNTVSDSDQSDHTGIYLGKGASGRDYFIHASSGSSKMKVLVQSFTGDSISSDYYSRNFSWGRRILD